ncbi:hypothetical protein F5I97DRAFT_1929424 [Phlebopus sp. FC_14]|nr:hypothetical protein F5I97DRAFT_1929424 [Phlebopus sp. FC_14]
MSAVPEQTNDLVAVACVVEASLLLACEWSRILGEYMVPLLKRLTELYPNHQFRLAFVTYGAADTQPSALLSKRFFAHLPLVMKELRENPSKLGIGQSNSGGGRGLCALEGLVAAIELFDILMASMNTVINHPSPQKDNNRSLVSHVLHVAASPPDGAQKPQCNALQHLDSVTWDTIPTELKKRKIHLSLISLRKIPTFQDLQSSVAGNGTQTPWFHVHSPHSLSLSGFPNPFKTNIKRLNESPLLDRSPEAKRQRLDVDPMSKVATNAPALPAARTPPKDRLPQFTSTQSPQVVPQNTPSPHTTAMQPAQPAQPIPAVAGAVSQSNTSRPPLANASVLEKVVNPPGITLGQMMERLKQLEMEVRDLDSQIAGAQSTGQAALAVGFQQERSTKSQLVQQIRYVFKQHYQSLQTKETQAAQPGTASSDEAKLNSNDAESVPPNHQPSNAPDSSAAIEERKSQVSDSQVLAHFWQSRGGNVTFPGSNNVTQGTNQGQPIAVVSPEVVVQMQSVNDHKAARSQNIGGTASPLASASQETTSNSNSASNLYTQALSATSWYGTFSWKLPRAGDQGAGEIQAYVVGLLAPSTPGDIRADTWPKTLALTLCKEPVRDGSELSNWIKRTQPLILQFKPNSRAADTSTNEKNFLSLIKLMSERRIYACAGWRLPSGQFSDNILIFPMGNSFAGAAFPLTGLPDLPGKANAQDVANPLEAQKPQIQGATAIPPLLARLQGLDPARRAQVMQQFVKARQEQQRRRQSQQQQVQDMPVPVVSHMNVNPYDAAATGSASSLFGNTAVPQRPDGGVYSAGGGTVNYEMLQSFMQRNIDGSASTGANLG